MSDDKEINLYVYGFNLYGFRPQIIKSIEELGELSVALAKFLNNLESNIFDEIVDVQIMLNQLIVMFGITEDKIDEHKWKKLDRYKKDILDKGVLKNA